MTVNLQLVCNSMTFAMDLDVLSLEFGSARELEILFLQRAEPDLAYKSVLG